MYVPTPSYSEQRYNDDLALWQAFRAGQREALGELFDRYAQPLFAYGHHLIDDAEAVKDAIQTVFVHLWSWRESLGEVVAVKFYLYRCLRRELLKTASVPRPHLAWPSPDDNEQSAEQRLVRAEDELRLSVRLRLSMDQLSSREKEIINLKYFSDFKIREIANLLQLSEQTVANQLYRALQKLRKAFVPCLAGLLLLALHRM
ncbi:RNA polymerase sigma factor [Hymenobacter jejuensis]|uniref:Sigma-70 family RNA polymerase sigma factor n=1 Tax=Hymenobacter jejuensis TaxID=2502781 RepID=A0A5B7ZWS8_9BACT|nr:sigma-70 family RNA polymerase sigma factor [Hymenobacter jejuensis]QDA58963.1 sigma-70 family RNA polymerase sigma factor [Hymenobacter jejuensis]